MAWIAVHQDLERHPKTLDLMSETGWDLDTCLGKLLRFWSWCVDYAEDGDLRRHNDNRLASAVGLNGDQGGWFVKAMVAARWLDRDPYFRVHDWWSHFGKFLQSKYKREPAKWERVREMYRTGTAPPLVPGTAPPNLTEPNLTEPNLPLSWESGFEPFWSEYPRKEDRAGALQVWNRLRPDDSLQAKIVAAVQQHKCSPQWLREEGRYIPHPAKWLRRRRWEDDVVQSEQVYSLNDIRRRAAERKSGQ